MRRKNDASKDELEGVAQRLRNERPEASPLQLDQIKTSAMSRAKSGSRRGRAGARRLATAGLTVGLLAAGTGGVIAGGGDGGGSHGNASFTQYGSNCIAGNGGSGGNGGNGGSANGGSGGKGSDGGSGGAGGAGGTGGAGGSGGAGGAGGSYNCNENSFNTTNNITDTSGAVTINNNYFTTTVAPAASSGVLGAKSTKPAFSSRHLKIHVHLSRKAHLRKLTLKINGKVYRVFKGSAASKNINLTNLPCSSGATTITIIAVTSTGKTVTESHTYHLCQA
jgi:hypothetical protein